MILSGRKGNAKGHCALTRAIGSSVGCEGCCSLIPKFFSSQTLYLLVSSILLGTEFPVLLVPSLVG